MAVSVGVANEWPYGSRTIPNNSEIEGFVAEHPGSIGDSRSIALILAYEGMSVLEGLGERLEKIGGATIRTHLTDEELKSIARVE